MNTLTITANHTDSCGVHKFAQVAFHCGCIVRQAVRGRRDRIPFHLAGIRRAFTQ